MSSFKPCLGYTSANEVVESEAVTVRRLFSAFAAGESIFGLTKWLNETGVKPMQSERWARTSVRGMLANPRYSARVVYKGEVLAIPGDWEAIIEPGLFDSVQAILTDPRRKTNGGRTARRHILSGLARCGECGSTVRGQAYAYVCPEFHLTKARSHTDDFVIGVVREYLAKAGPIIDEGSNGDPKLDARALELRGRMATIESDYDTGLIDGRRFAVASEKVQAELAEVERQRRGRSSSMAADAVLSSADPVKVFDASSLAIRRGVVDALVAITLHKREGASTGKFDRSTVQIEWKSSTS